MRAGPKLHGWSRGRIAAENLTISRISTKHPVRPRLRTFFKSFGAQIHNDFVRLMLSVPTTTEYYFFMRAACYSCHGHPL